MSQKKAANEIKKLLDDLPQKKTFREKFNTFFMIKLNLEIIEKAIEKTQVRQNAGMRKPILEKSLKQLLNTLDKIFEQHEELGDSDVRDRMASVIHKGFVHRLAPALPESFGMFTPAGEKRVQAALKKFLNHPEVLAASKSLKTPEDRLMAFQDDEVKSAEGNNYSEYFGYAKQPIRDFGPLGRSRR